MLIDFQVFPFTLKIKAPIQEKKGILLYAKTQEGKEAWSEVSPLPGFSKETLDDAQKQIEDLSKEIFAFDVKSISRRKLYPSVEFGLDSLFYALKHTFDLSISYPVCALLTGTFRQVQDQLPILLEGGYQHVKLKVSNLTADEAHFIIGQLLGKVSLKIDVNRAWNLNRALSFFSRYPIDAFEYIEEPVDHIKDLSLFPYPIALDESLREGMGFPLLPQIKALIVKPMLTGGLRSLQKVVDLSKSINAQLVLSSSYESGVGLFHLCSFLSRAKIPLYPLGVDTYRLINKDVIEKPHTLDMGVLHLSPLQNLQFTTLSKPKLH